MADKEYFDILREDGTSRGSIKERSRVHRDGDWHKTAHVWIHDGKGNVLVQKRGPLKYSHPNKWDVSCAGHVSAGDNSRNAAIRETAEELGLQISPLELKKLCSLKETFHDAGKHDNEFVDVYVVQRAVSVDSLVLQEEEVAAAQYISLTKLEVHIQRKDPAFVPHHEEYANLFAYLRQLHV